MTQDITDDMEHRRWIFNAWCNRDGMCPFWDKELKNTQWGEEKVETEWIVHGDSGYRVIMARNRKDAYYKASDDYLLGEKEDVIKEMNKFLVDLNTGEYKEYSE